MIVLRVDAESPDPSSIAAAAAEIRAGRLVAFPTETVYGLGSDALDPAAVERIYAAKRRPDYNPLIAHFADAAGAEGFASLWPPEASALADAFWPGPLTLVVRKHGHVPDRLTAGLETVAVRVPSHPVAHALLVAAGRPIAAPSANRFTELSPTTAAHVLKGLAGQVDLLLDAGPTRLGIESTVVDLSGPRPVLLRPGSISRARLEAVLGRPVALAGEIAGPAPRPSPGMTARHYSPKARLDLVPGESLAVRRRAEEAAAAGEVVGALLLHEPEVPAIRHPVRMPTDPDGYARELYAALHHLDDAGCDLVLVEAVPADPGWAGVRDRLARAAHPG